MTTSMVERVPAVSVIVGTYNCARFLPALWACLDAQTFRDFEVVVVDDASDDRDTLAALEARGNQIRLIRRTVNSGTCELPRYQGVARARAPLCAFLDADDRWDPTFLERAVQYLNAHADAAMVHTAVRLIDGEDRVYGIRHDGQIPAGSALAPALLRHCWITISAVVARRDIWLAALPEEKIRDFGMDQDFFVNIARRTPIRAVLVPPFAGQRERQEVAARSAQCPYARTHLPGRVLAGAGNPPGHAGDPGRGIC